MGRSHLDRNVQDRTIQQTFGVLLDD